MIVIKQRKEFWSRLYRLAIEWSEYPNNNLTQM